MAKAGTKDEHVGLTLGSRFEVRSVGSRDEVITTRGTFKGVVSVGTADGLAVVLDDSHGALAGKVRIIPSHVVLALDVIEQAHPEDETPDDAHMHYT